LELTVNPMRVLTLAGSLRAGSYNQLLLDAAAQLAPPSLQLNRYAELAGVPLFNEDVEARGLPPAVQRLYEATCAADALLVATPEYNQSIPGVLKNAIDWLSRPACKAALRGKFVGVIGVTVGQWGTRFAQAALRHVLFATESVVVPGTGLFLRDAGRLFNSDGQLRDAAVREALTRYLVEFASALQVVSKRAASPTTTPDARPQPAG
jgi:chromate reductase, NAD(P)H dehydrogenase (quinone)